VVKMWRCPTVIVLALLVLFVSAARGDAADMSGMVDTILGKYQSAGQAVAAGQLPFAALPCGSDSDLLGLTFHFILCRRCR
jgi:hypothetical protein